MKIEKIKKSGSKYKITLDNGEVISTFDDVILENNLLFDKNIDSSLLNKINTDTTYYEIYNKVLMMISRRLRSEHEIREYLDKTMVDINDKEKIIDNLKRIGLINDYNFAKAYTNDKINLSLDGPFKIAKELESHNIDSSIINEMIDIPSEVIDERLDKIISKKVKANKKYSGFVLKQKLIVYLVNLGYGRSDINRHLSLITLDNGLMFKEMEKFYKKYALKYNGDELYLKFRNKLYSKGYSLEEINEFVNKKQF